MSRAFEWNDRLDRRLRTMWAAGDTLAEIGKAAGTSARIVGTRAEALGLPKREMQTIRRKDKAA